MADDGPKDGASAKPEFKVFVGGISYRMDEIGLKDLFSKYDPEGAVIQVDRVTQKPRGFGFVLFKDRESMLDAVRDMHNKEVDGRPISVKEAIPQDQIKPGTPASAIARGSYSREGGGRYERYPDRRGGYDRGGYDRYGGGGYGGDRYGGYDPRGGYDYGRGYDYGAYERDPYYRDPYARDPYAAQPGYGGYEQRGYGDHRGYGHGGGAAYDSRYPEYPPADDRYRGAGGPDRSRYPAPRAAATPYDRPDARRDVRR